MAKANRLFLLPLLGLIATAADAPSLAALGILQPGRWTLSSRDPTFTARSICIGDPQVLLQIRQPIASCSRFVIANTAQAATVNYTCPGTGSGRSTIRVETPRLAQIDTQGTVGGDLFDLSIEARRTGDCTALSAR